MEYLLHLLILAGIYTMLAQSLALTAGFGGMVSLAHAGFYGIGAYTVALLSVNVGLSFVPAVLCAMLFAGVVALVVSAIALRTIDDYFIVCTLGIQAVAYALMNNCMSLTRGPLGIPGIPSIVIFGVVLQGKVSYLILTACCSAAIWLFLRRLTSSAFGRTLLALSEDEVFTQSLGKNVYAHKMTAFVIGAALASIPGALFAHYITYINPSSFTLDESIFILSIVIIGGMTRLFGAALAAAFLVFLPELLRFVGLPNAIAANLRQIIYGAILIAVIWRQTNRVATRPRTTA